MSDGFVPPAMPEPAVPPPLPTPVPLYTPGAVMLATVLGSPIAGAWLMGTNYRRMGQSREGGTRRRRRR